MSDMPGPLIVALDVDTADDAVMLAKKLDPAKVRVKVGKQLFTREGPQVVHRLRELGFQIFLDLKFHDIPNTVAKAVVAAADLGVWMVNVHAAGGERMMRAAIQALEGRDARPLITAVTVLTSMSEQDLVEQGIEQPPIERVVNLAKMASASGLDGVVCSAEEASILRAELGDAFLLVTPGIRLPGDDAGDQRRVVTPQAAMVSGASYLVVGRSITDADNPSAAISTILESIASS